MSLIQLIGTGEINKNLSVDPDSVIEVKFSLFWLNRVLSLKPLSSQNMEASSVS